MVHHVCFCADGNYLHYVPSVIESILKSNTLRFQFHIISDSERDSQFDQILALLADQPVVEWHTISVESFKGAKEIRHFTKAMYYRLMIPDLIDADKVLYLDCDVLVRDSIAPVFELDINNYYVAAVDNPLFERYEVLGLSTDKGYFNSGVMLFNSRKWREDNLKVAVIDVIRNQAEVLEMPDQDALNMTINGRWLRMEAKYNAQMSMFLRPNEMEKELQGLSAALQDPVIVHFSATNKQWHHSCFLKYVNEYKRLNSSITIAKRNYPVDVLYKVVQRLRLKYLAGNAYI